VCHAHQNIIDRREYIVISLITHRTASDAGVADHNNMTNVILIPVDSSEALQLHSVSWIEYHTFRESSIKLLLQEPHFLETPLLRPHQDAPGLYAYCNKTDEDLKEGLNRANIRATRLAMACGLLSQRFYGNVLLVRGFGGRWVDLSLGEIKGAACTSPDLREAIQAEVAKTGLQLIETIPSWLADAAQQNYHDKAALDQVARAMDFDVTRSESESSEESESDSDSIDSDTKLQISSSEFVAKSSLCLHCRALANSLCPDCEGAYFCPAPKSCGNIGWSHFCLCSTWKVYISHREDLASFPFFGEWQAGLTGRNFQTKEEPYELFLQSLGIDKDCNSWWTTETNGCMYFFFWHLCSDIKS